MAKIINEPGNNVSISPAGTWVTSYSAPTNTFTVSKEVWDQMNKGSATVPQQSSVLDQLEEEDVRAKVIETLREMGYIVISPPPVIS